MPVGVPRSGRTTVRFSNAVHEELAAEAYERNVSINQIIFEAIVVRRTLRGRPVMKQAMARLDARRTVDRELTAQVVEGAVTACVREIQQAKPLGDDERAVFETVRDSKYPTNADEVSLKLQMDVLKVAAILYRLSMRQLLVRVPGDRYRVSKMAARASPPLQ